MDYGRFFITTPIYYANDKPHLGSAYTTIAADIMARYWQKRGAEVFFLTGTDEHGLKVAQAAQKNNLKPQAFVDEIANSYKAAWSFLNIEYDNFVRTTDKYHIEFVQKFMQKLYDNGEIYKDTYKGLYCVGCEEYKMPEELEKNLICPIHKTKCQLVEEKIYFFRLSNYQKKLIEILQSKKLIIEPQSRWNEVFRFLSKEPLKDLAITRSKVEWGVPVPWDKEQTIYVWVDALLNYITGSRGLWPPTLQLMAKDIFRFHTIIWPALLLATGYDLPEKIFIHGYFTVNGQKMSKSLGNVVDPIEISKVYGVDALRYFLFREIPFGQDGDFSLDRFEKRYQADLANDLGNLFQRVLIMKSKFRVAWEYKISTKIFHEINKKMESLQFSDALNLIWAIINEANQQIDMERPWDLAKTNPPKLNKFICGLLETLSEIGNLVEPFMPATAQKIVTQLKTDKVEPLFPRKK